MVQAASQEAGRRGLNAAVRVMDAEQLELPDATFDRVLCGFGIMLVPDLERVLGELRRVRHPYRGDGVAGSRDSLALRG
jgi:ubiquinone/menaquinone biosynthesis C-methylase UbiE